MRQYKKEKIVYDNRWGFHRKKINLAPGLKQVHIGDGVWLFGKQSNDPIPHMVIYAPDRKTEHHVFGEMVRVLCEVKDAEWGIPGVSTVNRHGNQADEANVKIYILTSILDDRRNWCFHLKNIPPNGKLKVIYSNGTVKNIDFTGTFNPISIGKFYDKKYHPHNSNVVPIAYRKN